MAACVVDEAGQLTEAEASIVLSRWMEDLRLLVLVGDPKQLRSTILSDFARGKHYG